MTFSYLSAQNQRFTFSFVGGLNFAELEGEGLTDYFGPNAGLVGAYRFSSNWQLTTELLYSQNGEYVLPDFYPDIAYGTIRLHHIEVPVHLDLLIDLTPRNGYAEGAVGVGLAYARLFDYYLEDIEENDVTDLIVYDNKNGILFQGTVTSYFTPNFGLNLRASLPIQNGLGWTVTARLIYTL